MAYSIYHPLVINSPDEYSANRSGDFIICPFEYDTDSLRGSLFQDVSTICLFDIPRDLVLLFGDTCLDVAIFDYMNPLLLNDITYEHLKFYSTETLDPVSQFHCKCLIYSGVPADSTFYYPAGYSIDYKTCTISRATSGRQFIDLFSSSNSNTATISAAALLDALPNFIALNLLSSR